VGQGIAAADPRSARTDVGQDQGVIVHGTRVFRDRVPGRAAAPDEVSTTALGAWYATVLRWRRPVALLVNEPTLLPLLMPLAPARTLLARIPGAVAELLAAHRLPAPFIDAERAAMGEVRLAPTANRSVVGVLNEFTFLADVHRADVHRADVHRADVGRSDIGRADADGLLELSLQLAGTPLGPLYQQHVSPDRELAALVAERT
jgi:hypothetical protein